MDTRSFNRSIVSSYELICELGFARECINPTSLSVSKDFNSVALSSSSAHEDIYFSGLELRHYNILLKDYSFFQYSLSKSGEEPEARLAFIPNPTSDSTDIATPDNPKAGAALYEQMFKDGEIDFEEFSQALCEMAVRITIPIVRFDVSHSQFQRLDHPICHMHLGIDNTSRVATDRVFSPLTFTMFILRTFYFDVWSLKNTDGYALDQRLMKSKQSDYQLDDQIFCRIQKGVLNLC